MVLTSLGLMQYHLEPDRFYLRSILFRVLAYANIQVPVRCV